MIYVISIYINVINTFPHQVYCLFSFLGFMIYYYFSNSHVLFHGCPSSPRCRGSLLCCERGLLLLQSPRSGAAPPRRVGPSWTGYRTPVPCTGRQILTRCTTRDIRLFSDLKSRLGRFCPLPSYKEIHTLLLALASLFTLGSRTHL